MKPKTYSTPRGDVTVLSFVHSHYAGHPCYEVELTGVVDAFLGTTSIELARDLLPDGSMRLWYLPGDDHFQSYAAGLDALGAWNTTSEAE